MLFKQIFDPGTENAQRQGSGLGTTKGIHDEKTAHDLVKSANHQVEFSVSAPWRCGSCTYENLKKAENCRLCGNSKPKHFIVWTARGVREWLSQVGFDGEIQLFEKNRIDVYSLLSTVQTSRIYGTFVKENRNKLVKLLQQHEVEKLSSVSSLPTTTTTTTTTNLTTASSLSSSFLLSQQELISAQPAFSNLATVIWIQVLNFLSTPSISLASSLNRHFYLETQSPLIWTHERVLCKKNCIEWYNRFAILRKSKIYSTTQGLKW